MFQTLKGNKTRPCDCVCLENGVWVALRAGGTQGCCGAHPFLPAMLGCPLASTMGPCTPWLRAGPSQIEQSRG